MKINFRNVQETMVSGEPAVYHQHFANVIFNNTMDRRLADLAKEIYQGITIEVTEEELHKIAEFISFKSEEGVHALATFARRGLTEFVEGTLSGKIEHVEPPEEETLIPSEA